MTKAEQGDDTIRIRAAEGTEQVFRVHPDSARSRGEPSSQTLEEMASQSNNPQVRQGMALSLFADMSPDERAAVLTAIVKGEREEQAAALDVLLAEWAEQLREFDDLIEHARRQAPRLIAPRHIAHARERLDWAAVIAAQRPASGMQGLGSPAARDLAKSRAQLAETLEARIGEETVQDRIAVEYLAYFWGTYVGRIDQQADTIDSMIVDYITPDGWQIVSETTLSIETLERILTRQPSPPIMRPIFDPVGYGYSPSDGISAGATRALLGPGGAWQPRDDGYPEFRHTWGGNSLAWYSPDSGIFPTPEDALKAVECLSDGHVDAFQYMTSKWLANRDRTNRGPFDGVYISADEFLDDRGISRHKQGTHKPENVSEVAQQIRELSRFLVSGSVEGPPKRGKRAAVTIAAPLIVVSQYVKRPRLDGSEEEIGWYLRPGDWAATMQDLSPQYAVTTQALFQLHSRRDYMAKRIGRYLLQQFRYRASKGTYTQPFYIETILEGARIDITASDRKNPGRFRERIEGSLQTLTKTEAPVIKRWRYLDKVPETGRGMLEQWLRARIVCTPADGLTSRYAEITEKGKAGRTRALKGARRGT